MQPGSESPGLESSLERTSFCPRFIRLGVAGREQALEDALATLVRRFLSQEGRNLTSGSLQCSSTKPEDFWITCAKYARNRCAQGMGRGIKILDHSRVSDLSKPPPLEFPIL